VQFVQDAAGARLMLSDAVSTLKPSLAAGYLQARNSAAYRTLLSAGDQIATSVGDAGRAPANARALAASVAPLSADYQSAQRQDAAALARLTAQASGPATAVAVLVAGLGLVAVLFSVVLAVWLWWRIGREVTRVRDAAQALVAGQPPRPSGRQRADPAGDGPGAAAPLPVSRIRELAQTTAALAAARQLTVQAVATQNQLRNGAGQLFRKLGMRSHALAQRQLRLLAVIETGSSDPQAIAGLAAVGQLSTRLQRQADGLLVLSGGSLTRTGPVTPQIGDLLRAATAEVDDGSRATVVSDSADAITATAVADVLHLITELVENAIQHTPPLTEVTLRVGRVGRGLVVEIEDRGPGLAADDLASLNALLADPPDIGLAAGDGLGLLVTARLAARHGITVSLRSSPTAGTTAIVLLPHSILITGELRDTIIDGSLPRVDALTPPPVLTPARIPTPSAPLTPSPLPARPAGPLPPPSPLVARPSESAPPPPSPLPSRLPRRGASPDTAKPAPGNLAYPDAEREPATAAAPAPTTESLAPWHWLTENQPARRSAPEPPGTSLASDDPGQTGLGSALPRRVRPAASPWTRTASPVPGATDTSDGTDRDAVQEPDASPGDEPASDR
jgi:signal transduction histidine kinase